MMTRTRRNSAHAFGAKIAETMLPGNAFGSPKPNDLSALRPPVAAEPAFQPAHFQAPPPTPMAPPKPAPAPQQPQPPRQSMLAQWETPQMSLHDQKTFLDAAIQQQEREQKEINDAGWHDWGRQSWLTGKRPEVAEAYRNVGDVIDANSRRVGSALQSVAGQWGSWGLKPVSWFGRGMEYMRGPGAKQLNPAEQNEYSSLQRRVSDQEAAPLSPGETQRLQALSGQQKSVNTAKGNQAYWGGLADAAAQESDKLHGAVAKNMEALVSGEIPGSKSTTRIVPSANGAPARVEVIDANPLRQHYLDTANKLDPNSWSRAVSDVAYGAGEGAANSVALPLAGKALGAAGTVMGGMRGLQGAGTVLQNAEHMLNPALDPLMATNAGRLGTLLGGGALGGYTTYNALQADTPEARMMAAQNIPAATLGGAVAGNLLTQAVPAGWNAATNAYERALYPTANAATPAATAAAPAVAGAAPAAATAAQATPLANGAQAAGTFAKDFATNAAQGLAAGSAQGVAAMSGQRQQSENEARKNELAPNDISALNDRPQTAPPGTQQPQFNPENIPPMFLSHAARSMGRTGTGGIGTDALTHPDSGRAMTNDETSDFYKWLAQDGVYKGPNGAPGAIEARATAAADSAYQAALASTGKEQDALAAKNDAYKREYYGAYKENQQAQYSDNIAKIQELHTAGAKPEEIQPHIEAAAGNFVRSMPEEKRQEAATNAQEFVAQMQNPDKPPTPGAQKVEATAQQAFLDQASHTDPPPADPKGAGGWFNQKMEQFNEMPSGAKLALGIGLPLLLAGLMSGGGDDDGGGGGLGMLLGLLGVGIGLAGAAGGGLFGQGAQNAVIDTLGGMGQSAGLIPKELTPEQKSILLAKDPIQAAIASGGGNISREEAAKRVQAAHAQMGQLQQLRSVSGMFGSNGQARLFENMRMTPEEAALASKNMGLLTDAYSDPKSQLSQRLQDAQQYADSAKAKNWKDRLGGWALEKVGPQRAQQLLNWLRGKSKQGNAHMNIAQQIYLQHEMMKAARCWSGYEPVPGKKPYSDDSCRPIGSKAKKKEPAKKQAASSVFKLNEKKPEAVVNGAKPSTEASKEVSVKRTEPAKKEDLRPEEVLPAKA